MTVVDLYRQLFGRGGTTRGTDIDMAEHGRTGGISTGQPYKNVKIAEDEKIILDEVDDYTLYIGCATIGTATSANQWRIKKIFTTDTITTITWADGNTNFDNVWDDHTSLTYS